MKKYIVGLCISCIYGSVIAQQPPPQKGLQKISFGAVFAVTGTTSFKVKREQKIFTLAYNLSPNINIIRAKAYTNIMFGLGNEALKVVNGYWFIHQANIYVATAKNLRAKGGYVGLGIERLVKADNVPVFPFVEIGSTIDPGKFLCTLGFHANIQMPIWRKNK